MFIINNRWSTQKPPVGTQIDWGHPLAKGLIGCYLMNENGGNRLNNLINKKYSGSRASNSNGTIVSALWKPTAKGPGLYFDGSTSYVTLNDTFDFGGTVPYTVSATFKIESCVNAQLLAIVSKYDSNDFLSPGLRQWILRADGNGVNTFILRGHREVAPYVTSTARTYNAGVWYTAVMTYNGATLYCYVNGLLEGTAIIGSYSGGQSTNTYIGGLGDPLASPFKGDITSVYVWDKYLTPDLVRRYYSEPYCFLKPITHRFISTSGQVTPTETRLLRKLRIPLNSKVGIKDGVKMVWRY